MISVQNEPTQEPHTDTDRYSDLLDESRRIQGVSHWQDAWRRLRRNWVAMGSLIFLLLLGSSAITTPLWPLQSPIDQNLENRQFLEPERKSFSFDLVEPLAVHDKKVEALKKQLRAFSISKSGDLEEKFALRRELIQLHASSPMLQEWHNPGLIDRAMIRIRLAIFHDWCIPSLCGTDNLGRDILSRLFWGARVSLIVGIVASLVSLVIGVTYGATAGYLGGWIDNAMMRVVDVLYSIPFIFVVIFLLTFLTQEKIKAKLDHFGINQIMIFYIVIGAIYWLTMSRVVRGQVISLKNEQFIDAARTVGASQWRIISRHLIPNVMSIVIVYLTLTIPAVMLFEAFLSFLGLGVSPPDVSWGLLANEGISAITPVLTRWWLVLFPGLALASTLLALNFLGDGLRDALDPRMKHQ